MNRGTTSVGDDITQGKIARTNLKTKERKIAINESIKKNNY